MCMLWKTREEISILGQGILRENMKIELPQSVEMIIGKLNKSGYEAYAVGGCVRDAILGREPEDWDITTSAKPEVVKAIFAKTIDTGLQHGTVTIIDQHVGYEVTTYRIDGEYEDNRHPKEVTYTTSLSEDLKRRDFTINAMAYHPTTGMVDLFGGLEDLKRGIIRCVGCATERFSEDALRILRAVRFAAQLGFKIEEATMEAIRKLAGNLSSISAERIQTELTKLLVSPHPEEMRQLYELGIAQVILPEWVVMMETQQKNPHHCYTVGEHTIRVMQNVPAEKVLRYAALFHDVSKPECRTVDEKGVEHYHGHPERGAQVAKQIMRRLKMDNATIDAVYALVLHHDQRPQLTRAAVRRMINRTGLSCYPQLFVLKKADLLGQSEYKQQQKTEALEKYMELYEEILARKECLTLKDLAVNGKDLMELGVTQGRQIGEILHKLLELVLEDPEKNTREYLIGYTLENLFI